MELKPYPCPHGKWRYSKYGCRCGICRAANTIEQRRYRRRKKQKEKSLKICEILITADEELKQRTWN